MKLVFATHNKNKLAEVKAIMPSHIELLSLDDIGCTEDIIENGSTIEENASIKADYILKKYQVNCFADDTGLEVETLNGAPGVYSARYAGDQKSAEDNMDKLLDELKDKDNRNARFKTVIALRLQEGKNVFTGIVNGKITTEKHGGKGFGYDPIFQPNGYDQTFAEVSAEEKNNISHRGRAMQQLIDYLKLKAK
ncbi:non-canonical purine NTP diphosphatase [Galbibacter sp. EGI 63066]|uniref:non-canonical purine NTP diphosphatase n=1 Tax=Galbibacter sp. EGI 63066 TaxID=2993559 RepID=UPI00224921B6|nr:non-canonical purine NTP diphosphatase [Galbibacter sp. EGI 63066]MCX2679219.1 non-canonical purine NTP diphosphatase [Galbibacter sp. EGI 63066]